MITYPLQLPSQNIRRVRMIMEKVSSVAQSPFTLQEQVQEWIGGERWVAELELPPIRSRATAEAWLTFLGSLRGLVGTFEMGDPLGGTPRGSVLGTPVVDGIESAQSKTLDTTGWDINETGVLLKGDYVQLTVGGKKYLHKVLTDTDSDGSGDATIDVWPVTRVSVPDTTSVVTSSCKGTFRLMDTVQGWDADYLRLYGVAFKAVEAVGP